MFQYNGGTEEESRRRGVPVNIGQQLLSYLTVLENGHDRPKELLDDECPINSAPLALLIKAMTGLIEKVRQMPYSAAMEPETHLYAPIGKNTGGNPPYAQTLRIVPLARNTSASLGGSTDDGTWSQKEMLEHLDRHTSGQEDIDTRQELLT